MPEHMRETDEAAITELLLGRKVVSVEVFERPIKFEGHYGRAQGRMTLDNGREILVYPNEGGCSCSAGDYDLTSLERVDNIITRVDVEFDGVEDSWGEASGSYRIFVLAGHERINLLSVTGDDGNGYYGTGYELVVSDR